VQKSRKNAFFAPKMVQVPNILLPLLYEQTGSNKEKDEQLS
jgi:hypothetical protein